ncbi:hypothetical protein [Paenibacillus alkalitolerans]|uniref:hypothetical protein n=1 Tax=Paenibacillus alkalitolerans TaxID=2799335 RepID=UPI0018F34CA8|nr:hypothetical protein [Paenibacillus alkalitolerans]
MNKYDQERKNKLIASLLQAKADADRVLLYVMTNDENREKVMDIEDAREHIEIALERLTEAKEHA